MGRATVYTSVPPNVILFVKRDLVYEGFFHM